MLGADRIASSNADIIMYLEVGEKIDSSTNDNRLPSRHTMKDNFLMADGHVVTSNWRMMNVNGYRTAKRK